MRKDRTREVARTLARAIREGATARAPGVEGLSGDRLLGVLQRLASEAARRGEAYVEIGVYRGLSLLTVASAPGMGRVIGIDNFSQFDPGGQNRGIVEGHVARLGLANVTLVDRDFEEALAGLESHLEGRKAGVLFVDGPHDYRSQLMCLLLARPHLADGAAILVDDCNYRHVRQADRDFLAAFPEYRLLFEAYTACHPSNMTAAEHEEARRGFWNGLNVLVHDPGGVLEAMLPAAEGARRALEDDHVVHSDPYAELAPPALRLLGSIARVAPRDALRLGLSLWRESRRIRRGGGEIYAALNTYSAHLPKARLNPAAEEGDDGGKSPPARDAASRGATGRGA